MSRLGAAQSGRLGEIEKRRAEIAATCGGHGLTYNRPKEQLSRHTQLQINAVLVRQVAAREAARETQVRTGQTFPRHAEGTV